MSERLTSKTGIRDSLRNNGISKGLGQNHSQKSYNRFFEGFVEETVPKANGKGEKVIRVYIGTYYVPDQKKRKWILTKFIYTLLFVLATLLFVIAATRDIGVSGLGTPYILTIIPQPVCFIFILWNCVGLLNFWLAPQKMTIGEYRRGPEALKTASKCYSLALLIAAIAELGQLFICTTDCMRTVIFCAEVFLVAALLVFAMYRMERMQVYREQPNPNAVQKRQESNADSL